MTKKYFFFFLSAMLMTACIQKNTNQEAATIDSLKTNVSNDSINVQSEKALVQADMDKGEVWLRNIFKTKTSDKFFPDYNVEERLCSKRYQEFIADAAEIYGPSNLTDAEFPQAEKKFKEKWSAIYPIEEREMWLFGRGNGDITELKELKIAKIKDSLYRVFIDYGDGYVTDNELRLVLENGDYKIDYCKTVFEN